jgi:phage baseplate assembly protein W
MATALPAPLLGWPLLPVPDDQGRLNYPSLEQSVRESIRVILSTQAGEQLMRPEFGAGLSEFLHEPNTLVTRRRIRDRVQQALARWERRIEVDRVEVREVGAAPSQLRLEIAYRLVRTGAPGTIGVSIELER